MRRVSPGASPVCGELPILPEPSIRHGRFHPAVGPYPSRLRAVFAIRILEIGAADRVFRAPGLEGSGTGLIQNQPRGAGRELLERRGGSVREAHGVRPLLRGAIEGETLALILRLIGLSSSDWRLRRLRRYGLGTGAALPNHRRP
jgi:hypothetical protein